MKHFLNITFFFVLLFDVRAHTHTDIHPEIDVHCGMFMHDFSYFERLYIEHDDADMTKIIINSVGGIEFQNQILSKTHQIYTYITSFTHLHPNTTEISSAGDNARINFLLRVFQDHVTNRGICKILCTILYSLPFLDRKHICTYLHILSFSDSNLFIKTSAKR